MEKGEIPTGGAQRQLTTADNAHHCTSTWTWPNYFESTSFLFALCAEDRYYIFPTPSTIHNLSLKMTFPRPQSIAPRTESRSNKKRKLHPEGSDSETNKPFRSSPPIPMNLAESTNLLGEPRTQADAKTPPTTIALTDPSKKLASEASNSQPNTPQVCSPLDPAEPKGHHASKSEPRTKIPSVKSLDDLLIVKVYDGYSNTHMYDAAYHTTLDDVMYFCK